MDNIRDSKILTIANQLSKSSNFSTGRNIVLPSNKVENHKMNGQKWKVKIQQHHAVLSPRVFSMTNLENN